MDHLVYLHGCMGFVFNGTTLFVRRMVLVGESTDAHFSGMRTKISWEQHLQKKRDYQRRKRPATPPRILSTSHRAQVRRAWAANNQAMGRCGCGRKREPELKSCKKCRAKSRKSATHEATS